MVTEVIGDLERIQETFIQLLGDPKSKQLAVSVAAEASLLVAAYRWLKFKSMRPLTLSAKP